MFYNNKYVGIETVLAQITSIYKSINLTKQDIIEWVMDCEINHIAAVRDWTLFVDVPLEMDQKKALLPCNVYKLLEVRKGGDFIKFHNNGTYIFLNENYADLTITYRGIAVMEDGTPVIVRGHEDACARFCIMNHFEEDFAFGKMDQTRYGFIQDKWYEARDNARASLRHLTRNEIEELLQINADMIPLLGYIPKYNLD